MADFSTIKEEIDARITTTGNQEITGAILNDVLNDMVDGINEAIEPLENDGYLYAGVVTPTSAAPTATGKVFVLASTAGTYTNFGNLVVNEGEVAILKYNGTAWSKEMTGIASKEELSEVKDDIDNITGYLRNYGNWLDGRIKNFGDVGDVIDLTPTTSTVTRHQVIRVHEGDIINLKGYATGSWLLWAFVDKDYKLISCDGYHPQVQELELIAPEGARLLISNTNTSYDYDDIVVNHHGRMEERDFNEMKDLFLDKKIDFVTLNFSDGAYNAQGSIAFASQGFKHSEPLFVKKGSLLTATNWTSTTNISLLAEVEQDGTFIKRLVLGVNNRSNYSYIIDHDCYVSLSGYNSDVNKVNKATMTIFGYETTIPALKKWNGKRILFIGDSLTAAGKYPHYISVANGCAVRLHAKGGIGILAMVDGDGSERPEADPDDFGVSNIYPLIADDVEDVDLILILAGVNDFRLARDNNGQRGDMYPTQDTWKGRCNYAISRIYETLASANNNSCKVAIVAPHCFGTNQYMENETGYTIGEAILAGFEEAQWQYNVPIINCMKNCGIGKQNWSVFSADAEDFVHLNDAGYKKLADYVAGQIDTL